MTALLPGLDLPTPALPDGLTYHPDYLREAEASHLLAAVEQAPWRTELKRPRQFYGADYRVEGEVEPLPPWLAETAARLHAEGHMAALADRVLVNGYHPGQGIGAHVDDVDRCGGEVALLSLGSSVEMVFSEVGGDGQAALMLEPRSLLMLKGAARYGWTHGIPARKSDRVAGMWVARRWRISLTFRTARG
ncbi:MAG: alpha-ketoglutarate-dependent dioxygenase AlkB [Pseudomonadota bacterium]